MKHVPERTSLPLESGHEWWHWLGGRSSIDLLNTRRERWRRDIETLVRPAELADWLRQAHLLEGDHQATEAQLRRARRLREAIDELVLAVVDGRAVAQTAVARINRENPHAATSVFLHVDDGGRLTLTPAPAADPIDYALGRLALDASTVLGSDLRHRLRVCAADRCSTRFYDASRASTRQWCSMTRCGNAAKAQRHRARQAVDVD